MFQSRPPSVQLATAQWVRACVSDRVRHAVTVYPHFQPAPGALPLNDMKLCTLRLTAFDSSRDGYARRLRIQELASMLGAHVATEKAKWTDLSHLVCDIPGKLDPKQYESAIRKRIPVVSVKWLIDCFNANRRLAEDRYGVAPSSAPLTDGTATVRSLSRTLSYEVAVLGEHRIIISLSALASDAQLPGYAEELGATVHTWRNKEELSALLATSHPPLLMTRPRRLRMQVRLD